MSDMGCKCHGPWRRDPLREGCQCEGCQVFRAEDARDPDLDPHIGCHLLIRGWAGTPLTRGERAYRWAHMPAARQGAQLAWPQDRSGRVTSEDAQPCLLALEGS